MVTGQLEIQAPATIFINDVEKSFDAIAAAAVMSI